MFGRNKNFSAIDDYDDDSDATLLDETIDDVPVRPTSGEHLSQTPVKAAPATSSKSSRVVTNDRSILRNPLPHDFLRIRTDTEGPKGSTASGGGAAVDHVKGTPAIIVVDVKNAEVPNRILTGLYVKLSIVGGNGWTNQNISRVDARSGKHPVWNQRMTLTVPPQVSAVIINVELMSQNIIQDDKCVGCASIDATSIADGHMISSSYDLEESKDASYTGNVKFVGEIHLSLQYQKTQVKAQQPTVPTMRAGRNNQGQVLYTADGRPMLVDSAGRVQALHNGPAPTQRPAAPQPAVTPEQVSEIKSMFPDFSADVIEAILQETGSAEVAIEQILSMIE